jgi:glyoxylase I family protein
MSKITVGGVHHLVLTVSDLQRSVDFYTNVLDFRVNAGSIEAGRIFVVNGSMVIGLGLPPDGTKTPANDVFSEHRMGLDHLSLLVDSYNTLESAIQILDDNNVEHGAIKDLRPAGIAAFVLAFRDPDNIQLELTAPATN